MRNTKIRNTVIISCALTMIIELIFFSVMIKKTDLYQMLLVVLGIPLLIVLVTGFFIGLFSKDSKQSLVVTIAYAIIIVIVTNTLPLLFVTNQTLMEIVDRTNLSDGVSISMTGSFSFGQLLSTLFLYVIFGALGRVIGSSVNKRARNR